MINTVWEKIYYYNIIIAIGIFLSSAFFVFNVIRNEKKAFFRNPYFGVKLALMVSSGIYTTFFILALVGTLVSVTHQLLAASLLLTTVLLSNVASLIRNKYIPVVKHKHGGAEKWT